MRAVARTQRVCAIALMAASGCAAASDTLSVRPMFPANNVWNVAIDQLPLDPNSALYVATIGATRTAHADFGTVYAGAPNGIPYVVVTSAQPRVTVTFTYASESDPGPYPIPADAPIEGGPQSSGDRHVLIVDQSGGKLYELFAAYPNGDGSWHAGSGAIFNLDSNALRPAMWTSADAAGLPILPGLVRYEEVIAGELHHALRFTAPQTRNAYIWPARHQASSLTGQNYPPMGQRFRLKQSFDISGFGPNVRVILRALKKYGMFLADNGSAWYLSGAPDPRWDDNELHQLSQLQGSDFEAVDESSLMIDPNSGQANAAPPAPAPSVTTAVEFHCAAADRYLLTADPLLITALDGACVPGWTRTGESLRVFAATANVASVGANLCKASGHSAGNVALLIGARTPACETGMRRVPNVWPQSAVGLPAAAVPNEVDGSCGAGTMAVFGVVDDRPDLNHRYTPSLSVRDQMLGQGWRSAGSGALGVAMCAPAQ
jgi:hypothetical protein